MVISVNAALMATKLVSLLAKTILEEVNFKEDFESLCQEIVSIESLLNELREKRMNLSSMRNWIEKFEDFVEDATDMVEECREEFMVKGNGPFRNLFFQFSMGCKIRELKKRLTQLHGDSKYLKYLTVATALNVNALDLKIIEEQMEISTSLITESQIVGMKTDIDLIADKMFTGKAIEVIAIVGMGGLGKTLLAQQLYDQVSSGFQHRVWLHVTKQFSISHLYNEAKAQILKTKTQILKTKRSDDPTPGDLSHMREYLKETGLLIVLDDVWSVQDVHKIVNDAGFDRWKCRRTYIITSRNMIGVTDYTHVMKKLEEVASFSLFCIHAFPNRSDHTPPPELDSIARDIASKCAGLPLALKTVGRYMASVSMLPNDWQRALDHQNKAAPISDSVMPSLKLSYNALPSHLKPCFAYCSYFPKGADIDSECLVHGWIAQGFISCQVLAEEAYDLGKSYMYQLIDRCLLEISVVDAAGRPESLKMHDFLHDLALSLEQTNCFLGPVGDSRILKAEMCHGSRGISLMKDEIYTMDEDIRCPGLRTLLLRSNSKIKSIHPDFFKNMKYLTVLDLSSTCISSLPKSVQNLKHLKFFNLSHTDIDVLPEFLSDLKYLQFLDVSYCTNLTTLHTGIGKHQSLLQLNMHESPNINLFPVGISKLTSLHTLTGVVIEVSVDSEGRSINEGNADALKLQDLQGLKLLQFLSLHVKIRSVDHAPSFIRLEEGIFRDMTKMRTLVLINDDQMKFLRLPKDMKVMQGLENVWLDGCETPTWIFELKSIMALKLCGDRCCTFSQCKLLPGIPHLKSLDMWDNNACSKFPKLFGKPNAFPNLLSFQVVRFEGLRRFPPLDEKAMRRLKHLTFYWCNSLTYMPNGIEELQSLEEVTVNIQLPRPDIELFRKHPCWKRWEKKIKVRLVTEPEDGDGDGDVKVGLEGEGEGVQGGLEDEDEDEGEGVQSRLEDEGESVQGGLERGLENEEEYVFENGSDTDEGEGSQGVSKKGAKDFWVELEMKKKTTGQVKGDEDIKKKIKRTIDSDESADEGEGFQGVSKKGAKDFRVELEMKKKTTVQVKGDEDVKKIKKTVDTDIEDT